MRIMGLPRLMPVSIQLLCARAGWRVMSARATAPKETHRINERFTNFMVFAFFTPDAVRSFNEISIFTIPLQSSSDLLVNGESRSKTPHEPDFPCSRMEAQPAGLKHRPRAERNDPLQGRRLTVLTAHA